MDVKCPRCYKITTVFKHFQIVVQMVAIKAYRRMLFQKEATLKFLYMLKLKACIVHCKIKISSVIKLSSLEKCNSFTYVQTRSKKNLKVLSVLGRAHGGLRTWKMVALSLNSH